MWGSCKKDFSDVLNVAVNDMLFIFNGDSYIQRDGVAMGSPAGPSLANAFLCHHEVQWLDDCPEHFKPVLYRRYVDDTFLLFKKIDHVPLFLDYLNSKHANIKFTCETEVDNSLAFLDVKVNRVGNKFETDVYRKPTFTGLCTKFSSFIPINYKRNLVKTLTYRAFHICSSYLNLHKEIEFLRNLLFNNGFPVNFVDTYVGKTLNKLLSKPSQLAESVPKAVVYFPLVFTGSSSFTLRNKLNKLFNEFFPQVSVRIIFKNDNTIIKLFNIKDQIPIDLQSSLIYKFTCDSCKASYIGKTKRHLRSRIAEHRGLSARTGIRITKPPFSAIRDHSLEKDHPFSSSMFSVLAKSQWEQDLVIMESLLTYLHKPQIGTHESSAQLLCF